MTQAQNTNTTSNNSVAADAVVVEKKIEAFYAKPAADSNGPTVSIWINTVTTKGAPDFDGTINGQRVAMRIRNAEKGPFIAITKSLTAAEIGADGYKEQQIGTANIIVNDRAIPVLAIHMDDNKDKTIWANTSLKAPQDLLVKAGLNLEILGQKKTDYEAMKAEKAALAEAAKLAEPELAAA